MFRNVTGVQEAIVHRQSQTSLLNEDKEIKLIKDIQSDDIAQTYSSLKLQWFHQREKLIEELKTREKQNKHLHEIQHIKNLIECLNELIEHGEMTKNCQTLIDDVNKNIHLLPESYLLIRKPLEDKMIRLPRHISKTKTTIVDPSDTVAIRRSNEEILTKVVHPINSKEQQLDSTSDTDEVAKSPVSAENIKNGIQFYVIAEPFRDQADNKTTRKKRYISSTILE